MNVLVSSSPAPRAHPPRSNPFLRSSSDAPPFPCITPSRVTWVMVVSFMIAVPLPWRRPLWAASPLLRTPPPRSDTASRISLKKLSATPLRQHVGVEPVGPRAGCEPAAPGGAPPPLALTARIQRFGGYATDEVALAPEPFDARHH